MTDQNRSRYAPTKAAVICLVALSIGPLTLEGRLWRFDRRFFSPRTVNDLIALGMAVRHGNEVRST
jgi:hypothetical protein